MKELDKPMILVSSWGMRSVRVSAKEFLKRLRARGVHSEMVREIGRGRVREELCQVVDILWSILAW